MGYSIRNERWRLTLWRGLVDGKIYATELYDEVNAPAEPENLADKAENKEVIERLSKFLPPPIPAADTNAAKTPKGKNSRVDVGAKNKDEDATAPVIAPAGGTVPEAKSPSRTLEQLAADFKKADADKDGKLTGEEFLTLRKKDPVKGEKAFSRLDADKSGDLSEAEFLNRTKKD
jgi:hypothetical protein